MFKVNDKVMHVNDHHLIGKVIRIFPSCPMSAQAKYLVEWKHFNKPVLHYGHHLVIVKPLSERIKAKLQYLFQITKESSLIAVNAKAKPIDDYYTSLHSC